MQCVQKCEGGAVGPSGLTRRCSTTKVDVNNVDYAVCVERWSTSHVTSHVVCVVRDSELSLVIATRLTTVRRRATRLQCEFTGVFAARYYA